MPSRRLRRVALARIALVVVAVALSPFLGVPRPAAPAWADQGWLDTSDRDAVVAATEAAFGAEVPDLVWTGDRAGCHPGTSPVDHRRATITRVNYYRAMAGVVAAVSEDASLSSKAQQAAVMMSAEGRLTHEPPDTFACFSAIGQQAAANSNLYLGRTGPAAVDGYIEDPGDGNIDVGHRTTILHPPTRRMGVGDVTAGEDGPSANVLWVFDDRVFDETTGDDTPMREPDRFVAWPPRGYVPGELIHPRWSFTRAGVDLAGADVVVVTPSAPTSRRRPPLTVIERTGSPGHVPLPTLVWEVAPDRTPTVDTDHLVIITGVRPEAGILPVVDRDDAAPPTAYFYTVRILGERPGSSLTVPETLARIDRARG